MNSFLNFLINFIYPKHCVVCKKNNDYLCDDCFETVEYLIFPIKSKIDDPAFDSISSLTYLSPPVSQLIKAMKYQHVKDIARYLGGWLYLMLSTDKINIEKIDLITCVPMHSKRENWRGFNQAEIMAQTLAKLYGKKYLSLLIKKHQTKNQAAVGSHKIRKENLKNVFKINKKYLKIVKNSKILIIDDVLTTGATLNECSKILKDNHALMIVAMTLAHQD